MNKLIRRLFATGAFLLLGGFTLCAQAAGQQLYGITFYSNQLITVDTNTGEGTLVGQLAGNLSGYGVAARYGRLYTFDPNTNEIVEIDPATAKIGRYISIGLTGLTGEGDLAFRSDGVGFLVSALHGDGTLANDFYSFDVIAGTSHRIGTLGKSLDALAFDAKDKLYALAKDEATLYVLDSNTGLLEAVGPLGVDVNSPFAGMSFGPDGLLYAAINDQLYSINTTNGAATLCSADLNDIGYSSVSGLAYQMAQPPARLVGVTFFGHQLFSVATNDGSGTLIGNLGGTVSAYGVATRSNTVYAFNPNTDEIVTIDPTTGHAGNAISLGLTNLTGEGDLAFSTNGIGYLVSALKKDGSVDNGLYSFDVVNGMAQRVATTSESVDALAFDTNNVLYALGQDDDMLYIVNTNSGALTAVGSLGVGMSSPFAGMTFGPDGTLYGAINDQLFMIDKTSGAATPASTNVLDFGFSSVSGLTFAPSPAVLSLVREGGGFTLYWSGDGYTLLSSTNAAGPYATTGFQNNPARIQATGAQMSLSFGTGKAPGWQFNLLRGRKAGSGFLPWQAMVEFFNFDRRFPHRESSAAGVGESEDRVVDKNQVSILPWVIKSRGGFGSLEGMTNKLIRKLRSNASWSKLTEEQLNALEQWLIEDKLGYEEVLERARKEFGFEGSMTSLKRFYRSSKERRLLEELLESAAEAKKVCQARGESSVMREASVKVVAQQFFQRLREEGMGELRSLGELLMRAEANELQRERVEIQRQRQESWARWLDLQASRWQFDLVSEAQKMLPELTRLKQEADYAADPYLENRRLNAIRRRMFGPNIPDPAPESAEEEAARNAKKNARPDASA